jgi:hypothetical protein
LSRVYWPNDDPPDAYLLEKMPGQGKIGRDGLIVLTSRDPREAAQQVAHKLIGDDLPNAPLWLHVGFSRYLAGVRIHYFKDKWFACYGPAPGRFWPPPGCRDPGSCPTGRAALIPVEELFSADWTKYDQKGRYWYEYTAFALVSYLLHGKDRFHASRYFVFLAEIRQGKSDRDAFFAAYPHVLLDELDDELARFAVGNGHHRPPLPAALPHGFCRKIPPVPNADQVSQRVSVAEADIADAFDDFERLPLFRGRAGYYPRDVVDAEAAKRPPKPKPAPGPGSKPQAPTEDLELRDTGRAPGGPK